MMEEWVGYGGDDAGDGANDMKIILSVWVVYGATNGVFNSLTRTIIIEEKNKIITWLLV